MRDKIKDISYFNERVDALGNSIDRRINKLENNLIKEERISIVKLSMSTTYRNLIIAKYSRGDNMKSNDIIDLYTQSVSLMYENWTEGSGKFVYSKGNTTTILEQYTFSNYLGILEVISLGILLGISDTIFNKLIIYVERDRVKDFLLDFLFCYKDKGKTPIIEESYQVFFHINERYGRLKNIIQEPNSKIAEKELKYFLEKEWYASFKGTPIYGLHKNVHDLYVGYWCFVAAAIVKIKGLDDSTFRDNKYYPKDLIA